MGVSAGRSMNRFSTIAVKPRILFRSAGYEENGAELAAAQNHFSVIDNIADVRSGDVILGRFSLRPFYQDIENELKLKNAKLLVSHADYEYLNDMRRWYADLEGMTPKTWFDTEDVDDGPFFVKGITNSLKHDWNSAFAADATELQRVLDENRRDPLVGSQGMVIRQFVPLHTYMHTEKGMPITEEYRLFVYEGKVAAGGYYWSQYLDRINDVPDYSRIPSDFLDEAFQKIPARFYVMDVGITAEGKPTIIELNDPGMTGLAGVSADDLYGNLEKIFQGKR